MWLWSHLFQHPSWTISFVLLLCLNRYSICSHARKREQAAERGGKTDPEDIIFSSSVQILQSRMNSCLKAIVSIKTTIQAISWSLICNWKPAFLKIMQSAIFGVLAVGREKLVWSVQGIPVVNSHSNSAFHKKIFTEFYFQFVKNKQIIKTLQSVVPSLLVHENP